MSANDDVESPSRAREWRRRLVSGLPLLLVVAVGVYVLRASNDPDSDSEPDPVAIEASGPRFDSINELIAASDLVVEARVVSVDGGRAITDPADPTTGFTTDLFELDVLASYVDSAPSTIIVEQEAALLDGTPIVVNGLEPNRLGDVGFWFLIRGDNEEFPYVALVNEQGRLLYDDGERFIEPSALVESVTVLRDILSS